MPQTPREVSPGSERFFLYEGQTLGGYCLKRRIGSGAMADVWLANQKSLDRDVALKILRPGAALYDIDRFKREARAVARLEHPNIVRIYQVGEFLPPGKGKFFSRFFHAVGKTRLHFIAEEYIAGLNLRQWLAVRGTMSPSAVLSLMAQVAEALDVADREKIVHRDIKPENILLTPRALVKLVDFGVAAVGFDLDGFRVERTQIGMTLGTPLYMSPEQADGHSLDIRSDLYSLGATAYHCLVGKPPFTGTSPLDLLMAHRGAPVPPIREKARDVPEPVAALVERLLAKSPDDRPCNARVLRDQVLAVACELNFISGAAGSGSFSAEELDCLNVWNSDTQEQKRFTRQIRAYEATSLLRTRMIDADTRPKKYLSRRSFIVMIGVMIALGACLGGLFGYFAASDSQTKIERFATVEEQWVFASQIGTSAAWESVIDYFPDQPRWSHLAARQLARSLMQEGETRRARALFEEMARGDDPARAVYGRAGLAWYLASEGKNDRAAAIISDIRRVPALSYDRLTEDVITQACRLIREKQPAVNFPPASKN